MAAAAAASIGIGLIIFMLIAFVVWLSGLALLIKNYKQMPQWAIVISAITLSPIFPCPIIAIILSLVSRENVKMA